MVLCYRSYLKENSRNLRRNQTKEEKLLWFHLRNKKISNYQFYRQKPIDDYIVDFVCIKLKLIIEVDGSDHEYRYEEDQTRQKRLENLGFYVFRIKNDQVRNNLEGIIKAIEQIITSITIKR